MYYVNSNIKDLQRIYDQNSREGYLRLDLNENPGGLDEILIKNVLGGITAEMLAKYPETEDFTKKLADFIGVAPDEICLTNGSAEGIRHIIEVFTRPGGKIVSVDPTYAMYKVYAEMYGRCYVAVPYMENLRMNVKNILKEIDKATDLLIILNPNNPIGNAYRMDEVEELIAAAEKYSVTVLIDEAYFYFYPNSFIQFVKEKKSVFITRTFSKLFSIAGCRLGYVIGKKEGIAVLQKACTPHNVNIFGLKFAEAMMDKEIIDGLICEIADGKAYLEQSLREKGYDVKKSEGNFFFFKPKITAEVLTERLKEKRILVKHYNTELLKDFIRVTTGNRVIMQQFVTALEALDC